MKATAAAAQQIVRLRRRVEGACVDCGKPSEGYARCEPCRAKTAERVRKHRERTRKADDKARICRQCRKRKRGAMKCAVCLAKQSARQKRINERKVEQAAKRLAKGGR